MTTHRNKEKHFISPKKYAKNINKTAATDKKNVSMPNRFSKLILDYVNDPETGTDKKPLNHQTNIDMNVESTIPKTKSFTRPPVVINQHPENQRLYKDTLNETKSKDNSKQSNKIVVFGYRIPCETRVVKFIYFFKIR